MGLASAVAQWVFSPGGLHLVWDRAVVGGGGGGGST